MTARHDELCRRVRTTNAILADDICDEFDRLARAHDEQMERVKACEHIADGDEGWEKLEQLCPSTAAVARLRRQSSITVLASDAIKRGQEAIGYATSQQGWDADYARAHAEVVFLPETQN